MRTLIPVLVCAQLCACGKHEAPEHEVMPVQDTVFAPQMQALDKAKAVQQTLDAQQEKTAQALQDAEK